MNIYKLPLLTILICLGQTVFAQKEIPPKDKYLGQRPPGMVAKEFAPGIISTQSNEHSPLSFSPDGTVVLWAVMDSKFRGRIFEIKYKDGSWTKPASPSFADTTADDYCPSFSPDGKLLFSSRRKAPDGFPQGRGNRIWQVSKTENGWGNPVPFDTTVSKSKEFSHSVTKNGTVYFSAPSDGRTEMNIYRAERIGKSYSKPSPLPYGINSIGYEDGVFIAPDESYLIFESTRPEGIEGSHDLYISFKKKNGQWGMPRNMGPEINSGSMERFPRLSPDGNYFFFASNRDKSNGKVGYDFYWIDAKIIDIIKNRKEKDELIEQPLANKILTSLDKDDFTSASLLLAQWQQLHHHVDATIIYSSVLRKQRRYAEAEQLLQKNESTWKTVAGFIIEMSLVKFGLNKDEEAHALVTPLLTTGPQLINRLNYLAGELFAMQIFDLSDSYFEKSYTLNPNNTAHYNRACAYALIGNNDKAFGLLHTAIEKGFKTKTDYESDTSLASLMQDARWNELLIKLK